MTALFVATSPDQIAAHFMDRRFVDAEFMYKPRPAPGRARIVFDVAFRSRLDQLDESDAVLLIADSTDTLQSLAEVYNDYPRLCFGALVTNPLPWSGDPGDTPQRLNWLDAQHWRRFQTTDRWCRIEAALRVAQSLSGAGWLIMPAHDAVWGHGLLPRLIRLSNQHARQNIPAAVSPYTFYQHSDVPGASIPVDVIDLLNVAFGRDTLFAWKIRRDTVQAFWGKMGMIPFAICGSILENSARFVWEDDLEIDRVIRVLGYGVRCTWIRDPALYRQALPVFDREGMRQVVRRTLHYSLNIPGDLGSALNIPLGTLGRFRSLINPRFRRYNTEAETLIATCNAEIRARIEHFGASWIDWGAYRYVMRVGDPQVEVWQKSISR